MACGMCKMLLESEKTHGRGGSAGSQSRDHAVCLAIERDMLARCVTKVASHRAQFVCVCASVMCNYIVVALCVSVETYRHLMPRQTIISHQRDHARRYV